MPPETACDRAMLEISVAHDEARQVSAETLAHLEGCGECAQFAARIDEVDQLLASGDFSQAPDLAPDIMASIHRPRRQWWSIAAIALVGIVVGALVGGVGRLDVGEASDLGELFHTTGTGLEGLRAEMVIVERGLHPDVPERVYTGSIDYVAPEQLAIRLVDTTDYPSSTWLPNDVSMMISDGDMVIVSGSSCPVAALPDCLVEPTTRAVSDQPPFDDGVLLPLEIVGPGRSLAWSSGIEVLGTTDLDGTPAIQVRSSVAAVELIGAITDSGAWRELHPTDHVLMWLDEATLVPLRIEVFAADSPERQLWQLRHGYEDAPTDDAPLFIVELSRLVTQPGQVDVEVPANAPSRGFVDEDVDVPRPDLPDGFEAHRSGSWLLSDGARVEVESWSDGRSWLMVEAVAGWNEPRLFGLSLPFVEAVELGDGSVAYVAPSGDTVAIHGETSDILVSGSVPREILLTAAASIGIHGNEVPSTWEESTTVDIDDLPPKTLVPQVDGWSMLGRLDDETSTILITGSGARSVIITQRPGVRLDPPIGPDYSEIKVRGVDGRFNAAESTLEWTEDGHVLEMRSDTVGLDTLVNLAGTMEPN